MAKYNEARNIIVGASPLFLSTTDSTQGSDYNSDLVPNDADLGGVAFANGVSYTKTLNDAYDSNSATAKWRNVGYTNNGLQITYNPTYDSVTVDQLLDTAKLFKSAMEVMIATEMSEGTLANILVVFGQGNDTLTSTGSGTGATDTLGLEAGALGVQPTERQLVAVGNAPTTADDGTALARTERIYYARRVLSVQQSQFSLARTTPTTFPVTFRLLPKSQSSNAVGTPAAYKDYTGKEYGVIIDRVLEV
jgi:hypothetical protein